MTIFNDLGGNGKGVDLSGLRLSVFSRPKKKFGTAPTVPIVAPPPPPPPPPPLVYYYAPIIAAGGI